ncbi:response regulator transcription factor [Salisediminibacterium halotolerans]|uniref:DNA-binding response regulator, OmpR family, contains REC and winged-helix (WHTH) domain n=1 Tax=Salisediminibacterium halotolerans TaxID=517425 RepID=A0A1H9SYA5_9BACI|nr:response regulator transcription factor [Salisediminibacterium haloalkalitolerans]SER89774.1 DNA-binding response regulator, OmpR family, contains REC and winged-helix (wHTH) domain [Salisediminibacterium haloalkalitolerans]
MSNSIKILTVEDDPNITELIEMYLNKAGFEPITAHDGEIGLEMFYEHSPDCIILDLMLPEIDGWEVCRAIRLEDSHVPILMLTGKGESYDVVKGLDLGADDYIVKPFDPNELMARVKAVLRRTGLLHGQEEVLTFSNLQINLKEFKVLINEREIFMPRREIELLYYFASYPSQVFSRQQLLDNVWGYEFEGDPRTVDVHIKRIRDKLLKAGADWFVTTVRGIGYRFEEKQHD